MEWNPYIQLNIKFVSLAQSKKQFAETEIEGNINTNSSIDGFYIDGMRVRIKDDKINVEYNGSSYDFFKVEFNRKPRAVMQKIFNIKMCVSN